MKTSSDTFFRIWLALQLGTIATSWGSGWQLGSDQLGFQLGVAIQEVEYIQWGWLVGNNRMFAGDYQEEAGRTVRVVQLEEQLTLDEVLLKLRSFALTPLLRNVSYPNPGTLELEFITPSEANNFRNNHAFQTAFVSRFLNCRYHPQPPHPQLYFFKGLKADRQRAVFNLAERIAPCHLVTAYANDKLSPSGKLILFRKEPLSDQQFKQLANQLKAVGVELSHMEEGIANYKIRLTYSPKEPEQDMAGCMQARLATFASPHPYTQMDSPSISSRSLSLVLSGQTPATTLQVFESARQWALQQKDITVRLHYQPAREANSYLTLFTEGLSKPLQIPDKQFEHCLLTEFRKVNRNILQVVLSSKTERYSCTIDFIEEQDGKDFIVDAEARLSALRPLYQSGQQPTFNIYIDLNTNKIIRNQKNQVLKESRQRIIEEEARKLQLKQFIEQEEYWLAQRQELERKHKQFEEMQRRQWEEERLRQIEEQLLMNNCLAVCQINRKLYKISELYYNGKPDTTVYSPFLFPQMRLRLPLIPPTIPRPNFESTISPPNPFILRRLSLSPQELAPKPIKKFIFPKRDQDFFSLCEYDRLESLLLQRMDLLKLEEATSKRYIKPTIRFCAGSLGLSDKEAEVITEKMVRRLSVKELLGCLEDRDEFIKQLKNTT